MLLMHNNGIKNTALNDSHVLYLSNHTHRLRPVGQSAGETTMNMLLHPPPS